MRHLKTIMHEDRMKYPNGFKFEDKCSRKYVVVYKDYLTEEEMDEILHTHTGYDSVWTYGIREMIGAMLKEYMTFQKINSKADASQ